MVAFVACCCAEAQGAVVGVEFLVVPGQPEVLPGTLESWQHVSAVESCNLAVVVHVRRRTVQTPAPLQPCWTERQKHQSILYDLQQAFAGCVQEEAIHCFRPAWGL